MILIVGASGTLGKKICRRLLDKGERIRGMTRSPELLKEFEQAGAEVFKGDLRDKNSINSACDGADIVIASAHSLFGRGSSSSRKVDFQGHIDLIDSAKEAGVRQFIYISILQADKQVNNTFLKCKQDVEEYLIKSGLNYTIIRPGAFMEIHAHLLIGEPIINKHKVTIFGKGEAPKNFVAADDVAAKVVAAINNEDYFYKTINVSGPENLSSKEVIAKYAQFTGTKPKINHIPRFALSTMSGLLKPFHPGLSQIMSFGLYMDKVGDDYMPDPESMTLDEWMRLNISL